jgi:hypothetical protein
MTQCTPAIVVDALDALSISRVQAAASVVDIERGASLGVDDLLI